MNFFLFSRRPRRCARHYCDKHLVKIILEILQLLFSAVSIAEFDGEQMPLDDACLQKHSVRKTYRVTHRNHPCAICVRRCPRAFLYVCELGLALCHEYTLRFRKTHACERGIRALHERGLLQTVPDDFKPDTVLAWVPSPRGPVRVPLCMPEECIVRGPDGRPDAVRSHRRYFVAEKASKPGMARWKRRTPPAWFQGSCAQDAAAPGNL